ncbi:hypothetical protein EXE58_02490 [Nocardioides seonyuensis]|uniref:EfeO-type cupredoxin-like domain-containing protein n=1 Tax=Nocardioides seonyuensis TaxID=2518371 RepID=A0A4P7IBM8_9ACTN|nr:hypothetical protein [Nocardioides seonyuensis]QBX54446.1 hypothetical protein EXE58_02490 [Nocardioides seonyuensis]
MHRRLLARTAPLGLVLALALTGCGTDDGSDPNTPSGEATERTSTPEPSETPTETESAEPEEELPSNVITITRQGGKITPNGERVKVPLGEEITLAIEADEAGELHVHSTPEQEISYKKGISAHQLTFKQPGVVEVESHEPDVVVLQLQVS